MHMTELAKVAWRRAGLHESGNGKIKAFLDYVNSQPTLVWADAMAALRNEQANVFREFTEPLLYSHDKLLRLAVIRNTDPTKRRELNLLKAFVEQATPHADEPELLAIVELGHKGLTASLRQRNDLTTQLRNRIGRSTA